MKKLPYFLHLILFNLLLFFVIIEDKINNIFIILVVLLFVNLVHYQYSLDTKLYNFNRKSYKKIYLLERFTSINVIFVCIVLVVLSFSDIVTNKYLVLFIAAFSIIHLILGSDYTKVSDMIFNHIDDEVINEIDDKALKKANNYYTLPYYLVIASLVGYAYYLEYITIVIVGLLFALTVLTIPFFSRGPKTAKLAIRRENKYVYEQLKLPIQVAEPTSYSLLVFLVLVGLYAVLYFVQRMEYLSNLIIVAVISLHAIHFNEFGIVVSYYLNEKESKPEE